VAVVVAVLLEAKDVLAAEPVVIAQARH